MTYDVLVGGSTFRVELTRGEKSWHCRLADSSGVQRELEIDALAPTADTLSLLIAGHSYEVRRDSGSGELSLQGERFAVELRDLRSLRSRRVHQEQGPKKVLAPMPGKIVRLLVAKNSEVQAGQGILVVEAMKMQNELKSPKAGIVTELLVSEGAAVNAGDPLAVIA